MNPAVGEWVMRVVPQPLKPAEIKELYALPAKDPSLLTKLSTLKIPEGTRIRVGIAGENTFGGGGMVQWQVIDKVKPEWAALLR